MVLSSIACNANVHFLNNPMYSCKNKWLTNFWGSASTEMSVWTGILRPEKYVIFWYQPMIKGMPQLWINVITYPYFKLNAGLAYLSLHSCQIHIKAYLRFDTTAAFSNRSWVFEIAAAFWNRSCVLKSQLHFWNRICVLQSLLRFAIAAALWNRCCVLKSFSGCDISSSPPTGRAGWFVMFL